MENWYYETWTPNTKFGLKYEKKLETKQTPFQKVEFYKSQEWGVFFTLDGLLMLTEKDEFIYHEMITHIAMAVNPKVKQVLVIGAGDGGTIRELNRYSTIAQIDIVEIDEEVINLSKKYLPQIACSFDDPRCHLKIEDGISYVQQCSSEKYDLIIVDSTDPIGVGEGLFSNEFYQNCFRILNPNGILINQHESPYFAKYSSEMKKAHQKIAKIFPISEVYQIHQATYPSGHWLFGFASKKLHPLSDHSPSEWSKFNLKTKYYNSKIHQGSFALPTYVKEMLRGDYEIK